MAARPLPSANVSTGEKGASGTRNFNGRIENGDPNTSLTHSLAYGTGAKWGEWETLVRTDPDIASALSYVVSPLRDALLNVEPAEHPLVDPVEAQKHADFVKFNLEHFLQTRWVDLVQQQVRGALGSGFALHEKVHAVCEHPLLPGGKGYGVRRLAERLPSTVAVNGWRERENENGEVDLAVVVQRGQMRVAGNATSMMLSDIELPAESLLLTTWDRSGNNYAGCSIFRPVYYLARVRQALARIIAIGHERESLGVPVASGDTDLDEAKYQELLRQLEDIRFHEDAAMVMPKGWKLEFITSAATNKQSVIDAYNHLGMLILRQCNAQLLALGTSDNTGNRSLGEVHAGVSESFLNGVVSMLEGVWNGDRPYNGLARAIVVPNWGEQPAYPRISLTLKKSEMAVPQKIEAIVKAAAGGLIRISDEDEKAVREMVGLSTEVEPREEAPGASEEPGESAEHDDGEAETEAPEAKPSSPSAPPAPETKKMRFGTDAVFQPSRPLRESEQVIALSEIANYLGFAGKTGTAVQSFESQVRPVVAEMLVKALPAIKEAMADGDPSEVASIQLDTSRLTPIVDKYLRDAEAEGYRQAKAEKDKGKAAEVLKKRADGDPGVKPIAMAADGSGAVKKAQTALTVRRLVSRLKEAIDQEAVEVARTGGEPIEVVDRVLSRQLDTAAFRTEASTITARAFNMGREEFAAQFADQVADVEYSAILDGNQCDPCEALDGQTWEFGSAEHDANTPPNRDCEGWGKCRCMLVYRWQSGSNE